MDNAAHQSDLDRLADDLIGQLWSLDPDEQVKVLAEWRLSHPDVCQSVESLLAAKASAQLCDAREAGVLLLTDMARDDEPEASTIGLYRILGEIGRGGMGVVYKARHADLEREVALKVLLTGKHTSAVERQRFRAEAQAVARLKHPNIVQIHEVGEHEGQPFLALEYVEGESLGQKLGENPQQPRDAAQMVETLARAVHHAHERGVVHRDLKPDNVMVAKDGTPKIADLGLAKKLDDQDSHSISGSVAGTPNYMAPEQAEGRKDIDPRLVDVYGLGAILYKCLTGRPPFQAPTVPETLVQVKSLEPVSPRLHQRGAPRDLETICLKCLQKEPAKRYPSALELAEDLRRYLDGRPILARPIPSWEKAWKWVRRNPAKSLGVTAGFLLLILGLFYWWKSQEAALNAREAALNAQEADQKEREATKERFHARIYRAWMIITQSYHSREINPDQASFLTRSAIKELTEIDEENHGKPEVRLGLVMGYSTFGIVEFTQLLRSPRAKMIVPSTNLRVMLKPLLAESAKRAEVALPWFERAIDHLQSTPADALRDYEALGWPEDERRKFVTEAIDTARCGRAICLLLLERYTEALEGLDPVVPPDWSAQPITGIADQFRVLLQAQQLFNIDPRQSGMEYLRPKLRPLRTVILLCAEMEQADMPWSGGKERNPAKADHAKAIKNADFLVAQPGVNPKAIYNAACVYALASAAAKDDTADRHVERAVELLRLASCRGYIDVPHILKDHDLDPLRRRADFANLLWDLADTPAK